MTTPFWCLLVVTFLPYALSTLGGVMRVRQLGKLDNKYPRQQAQQLAGIGARTLAAQQNAWEALPVFAAAVIVAHLADADAEKSATASLVFVATRVLHAVFYIANLDALRSLIFLVGLASAAYLFALAV